jgi:hypothetical protein
MRFHTGVRQPTGCAAAAHRAFLVFCDLRQSGHARSPQNEAMWQPISSAPFARDIQLAVIDDDGPHALVFPCRRILNGWMNADTKERLDVRPTHWREWGTATAACA